MSETKTLYTAAAIRSGKVETVLVVTPNLTKAQSALINFLDTVGGTAKDMARGVMEDISDGKLTDDVTVQINDELNVQLFSHVIALDPVVPEPLQTKVTWKDVADANNEMDEAHRTWMNLAVHTSEGKRARVALNEAMDRYTAVYKTYQLQLQKGK